MSAIATADAASPAVPADEAWARWGDACAAAAVAAVASSFIGGVRLRARHGPTRDAWLAGFRALLSPQQPWHRLGPNADDNTLFGGLDIAATLAAGRAVMARGLLERAAGGWLVLASAERCPVPVAARIGNVLDGTPARGFGLLALDEGIDDERLPDALGDRLALHVEPGEQPRSVRESAWPIDAAAVERAGGCLPQVQIQASLFEAICETSAALGIVSLRAPLAALAVARIAAALDARTTVAEDDIALAVRLVLAPRARQWPAASDEDSPAERETPADIEPPDAPDDADADAGASENDADTGGVPDVDDDSGSDTQRSDTPNRPETASERDETEAPGDDWQEMLLEAARAVVPQGLLDSDAATPALAARLGATGGGRHGAGQAGGGRGRPVGTRAGMPGPQQRLDVMATLRAAAPWQRVRGRTESSPRLRVRVEDFRVRRYRQPPESATLFVVDASGSAALHRLAETKGAIELLLADCYVRRDRVGLIAFRGTTAETLLPPTRSLTRARRSLAGLPGGGPTPLASALDLAAQQAALSARDGLQPLIVLLTDGRGNIARDGRADRRRAAADVEAAADVLRGQGYRSVLIDTSPRPREAARQLAERLGGRYLPLPQADAMRLSDAVREVSA